MREAASASTEASPHQGPASSPLGSPVVRRNIVFPDPVAFRFLEEDSCVRVVERRSTLRGYELYLVEQWACSRQSPTLVIAIYTGDFSHSIDVGVLSVPEDRALWSAKLRVYLKAAHQHHARPKETKLGELLVTNLSSFPSALTVIPVPEGDVRKHRQLFIVNENLKRLGCSGRSGLTLTHPTEATQAKFQQLYRTSDRIPFLQSVTELIKLCQVALYMFEKLDYEYIDGLLCDVTETAIGDWWTEIGAEHYNFEPTDGILGPSTVAALLGMLMGARNRLHWYGAPVSKDVFDIDNTKRGVAYFQKQQKLDKTRRLDRQTVFRLHTATAKAASGEGWGVQKAVKSTMTEIGGKRGEIVLDMVSGKDKGGLADIETVDIDVFASLAYGERPKWLWHGKPRRTPTDLAGNHEELGALLYKHDSINHIAKRTQSMPLEDELDPRMREDGTAMYATMPAGSTANVTDGHGEREASKKNVFKSVAGKMNDARSGLGRIKDAVGGSRRGHASRPSVSAKEDIWENGNAAASNAQNKAVASSPAIVTKASLMKTKQEEYIGAQKRDPSDSLPRSSAELRDASPLSDFKSNEGPAEDGLYSHDLDSTLETIGAEARQDISSQGPLSARHAADNGDLEGPLLGEERIDSRRLACSRRHSCGVYNIAYESAMNENRWARRMSFGDAEQAVLTWTEIVDYTDAVDDAESYLVRAEVAKRLGRLINHVTRDVEPWVEEKLKLVVSLDERYARDITELQGLYRQLSQACQRVKQNSDELLAAERISLARSVKEVETLFARLEYEIDSLAQKVNDVEDGVQTFERQVVDVEKRAEELKTQLETESWLHWFVRTLTGIGTGPNITRETG
ncbi:hypothetical protein HIM_03103 [Hirsutella minnesotensis 3608]|nr:hypothetical protein HIM_03103 [Hirsutella minnesotensis 3608]